MSESSSRLPARPSLEQLHKQAKELLQQHRAGDQSATQRFRASGARLRETATLADAQFVLAREYGFETWATLKHHIEAATTSDTADALQRLPWDLLAAHNGDAEALKRLNHLLASSITVDQLHQRVAQRMEALVPGAEHRTGEFALADARFFIARQYGFDNWATFAESIVRPPSDPRAVPLGMSATPPFYTIDWTDSTVELRPPLSEKDWDTIVGLMKEMQLTGLNAGGQMTDHAAVRLAELQHVTSLHLGGSKKLTDAGLRHLGRMPQLERLDLSGWESPITDQGLEVLRSLPALKWFQMCWPQRVTDAGVAHLEFCERLETVDVMGTRTGDGVIRALAGKPKLRQLKTGSGVTAASLPLFHQFPMFKTWQGGELSYGLLDFNAKPTYLLLPAHFTRRGFEHLAGLDGLFALNLAGPSVMAAEDLEPLVQLSNLGWLGADPSDAAMRCIASMPRLRMLMCQDTQAGDDGFVALSRSQSIEYIWGRRCHNLRGRGFSALASMPALRGLSVSCKNVDDEALAALPRFPALEEFMPMDVSDEGFVHVGRCERLQALWCMYCRDTTDAATAHIAGLHNLKAYYAGSTRITDRSLEILGGISSLERIDLQDCRGISNAGIAHLASLPRLQDVSLGGLPRVTREGASVFPATVRVKYSP